MNTELYFEQMYPVFSLPGCKMKTRPYVDRMANCNLELYTLVAQDY